MAVIHYWFGGCELTVSPQRLNQRQRKQKERNQTCEHFAEIRLLRKGILQVVLATNFLFKGKYNLNKYLTVFLKLYFRIFNTLRFFVCIIIFIGNVGVITRTLYTLLECYKLTFHISLD